MGLLMSCYLIKKNGHNFIYLGSSLPTESVITMNDSLSFNYIITTTSISRSEEDMNQELLSLATRYPDKTIFIGGSKSESLLLGLPENIYLMKSLDEFNDFLEQL